MAELFSKYYPQLSEQALDRSNVIGTEASAISYNETATGAHINGIVVDPEYRKMGAATTLIDELKNDYDELTANVLMVERDRLAFWGKMGFTVVEVGPDMEYFVMRWVRK